MACLIKEVQLSTELRRLSSMSLVSADTAEALIRRKFGGGGGDDEKREGEGEKKEEEAGKGPAKRRSVKKKKREEGAAREDPLLRGEFDVIRELLQTEPLAEEGKRRLDRALDLCGPPPRGTGLQNLRECIMETKWKYDVAHEDKQASWRELILNFMDRSGQVGIGAFLRT